MFEDAMNFDFAQEGFEKKLLEKQKPSTAEMAEDWRRVRREIRNKNSLRSRRYLGVLCGYNLCFADLGITHHTIYSFQQRGKDLKPLALLVCTIMLIPNSSAQIDNSTRQLAHDIFKQLIEINTTDSVGNVTTASEAMAQRFRDAGFAQSDIYIGGPKDRKKNLVVRLHGSGAQKPVLLIGHLDVVEARREDWTTDPFQFNEKDGFFYGRGTQDMKDEDAIMVATLIQFKKEGFVPDRDVILALTADEEGGQSNGVDWLVKNHRELIDAEFVVNTDDITLWSEKGKPVEMQVDASEKIYSDYQLVVTDAGGHSSLPKPDNPIYKLARALDRLQRFQFPLEFNEVTRAYYEQMAKAASGQRAKDIKAILRDPPDKSAAARLSQDVNDNATLHTTCVATRVNAGHANNALPQRAEAVVNCRILPGHTKKEVRDTLLRVAADPAVAIRYIGNDGVVSDNVPDTPVFTPHPLRKDVLSAVEKVTHEMWPGIPIVPTMARGASDGVFSTAAGMPTYVVAGVAVDRNDDREHGRDERVGVDSFYRGLEFWYQFLKTLTSEK
jgi:acetylornithine deacetylase/succinyl-diaminopimelate desuccinylase-like protein